MEDDYRGPATEPPTKKMDIYTDIMRHMIALCKHINLPCNIKFWVKMVIKMFDSIHTEFKNFL